MSRKEEIYYRMCRFWGRIFAINFGVGVVSGVVMEFEFGTNWARFSAAGANVFAPLLYFEVLTAFFLEGGFLGIMLFGWNRVGRSIHFLATCLVAGGSVLSAFWILAANSWMQTPAGFRIVNGEFAPTSFRAVIFNPSTLIRFGHMTVAAFETAAFAVAGISAFFLLRRRSVPFFRRSMAVALLSAALFAPLQVYLGDASGREVFAHQPAEARRHGEPLGDEHDGEARPSPSSPSPTGGGKELLRDLHSRRPQPAGDPQPARAASRASKSSRERTGRTCPCFLRPSASWWP